MKVYLAGPIRGLTYKQATDWRNYVTKQLASEVQTISPLRGEKFSDDTILWDGDPGIVKQDLSDIRRCDLMLVNLLEANESIGTLIEMGYAAALNKLIIVVMDSESIYQHPFVREMAIIEDTLDDAISRIKTIFKE